MKFELEDYHRNLSNEELLSDLKNVAELLGRNSVTFNEYTENGKYNSSTIMRRFGGWNKALEKAGLQSTKLINILEEDLFKNLEEMWIKLGRQPRYSQVQKPLSKYTADTYANRFGSYRKALEKFVVFINNEESVSSEESISTLQIEPITRHKTSRSINWRLRFIVMKRDNFKCKNCGKSPATDINTILHVDHIKAWAKGGETILENLQTLCSVCNIGKSDLE